MQKKRLVDEVPNEFLVLDKTIETACNEARSAINIYRNTDGIVGRHIGQNDPTEPRLIRSSYDDENMFIPPQFRIAKMNENIITYLNRSSQLLSSKLIDEMPLPKTREEYLQATYDASNQGKIRKLDTMLYASNIVMLTNSLDANLFKQAASTVYDGYDIDADKITMTVSRLRERLMTEHDKIYKALFENGLEEFKGTLTPLRNTAGHSDISQKILFENHMENPKIIYQGEKQDAYPVIQKIAIAYLNKAAGVYWALGREIREHGEKPFIADFIRRQNERYDGIHGRTNNNHRP